eukprot:scaffold507160_cov153-Attheya_sp.AAC.1
MKSRKGIPKEGTCVAGVVKNGIQAELVGSCSRPVIAPILLAFIWVERSLVVHIDHSVCQMVGTVIVHLLQGNLFKTTVVVIHVFATHSSSIIAKARHGRLVEQFASDAIVVHGHRFGLRCRMGFRHLMQLPPNNAKGMVYPFLSFRRRDKCIVEDC